MAAVGGTIQFENATEFNSDLFWDVSRVTTMSATFNFASSFSGDVSNWDTSNCIDMTSMFGNTFFNGDISLWNTERVVRMISMFDAAASFNNNIGSWNVSNVVFMSQMFRLALNFNQDISGWDVRQTTAMDSMFQVRVFFVSSVRESRMFVIMVAWWCHSC